MGWDFVAFLSMPVLAAQEVFIVVTAMSVLFYRVSVKRKRINVELYWKAMAFLAELLVVVGLIGLVTYAGRAKLDDNKHTRIEKQRQSELEVQRHMNGIAFTFCVRPDSFSIPSARSAPLYLLCQVIKEYGAIYNDKLDWKAAILKLQEVSKDPLTVPLLKEDVDMLISQIDAMGKARIEVSGSQWEDEYLRTRAPWAFVLACAFCASLGVSIKCARAFAELRKQMAVKVVPSASQKSL